MLWRGSYLMTRGHKAWHFTVEGMRRKTTLWRSQQLVLQCQCHDSSDDESNSSSDNEDSSSEESKDWATQTKRIVKLKQDNTRADQPRDDPLRTTTTTAEESKRRNSRACQRTYKSHWVDMNCIVRSRSNATKLSWWSWSVALRDICAWLGHIQYTFHYAHTLKKTLKPVSYKQTMTHINKLWIRKPINTFVSPLLNFCVLT